MLHIAFWILHTIIKGDANVYCLRLTFHLLFTLFLVVDASHLNASGHFCPTNGSFSLLFFKKQTKHNWWAFYLKQLLTKAVNASDQGDIILLNIRILKPLPFKTLINIQMQRCIKPVFQCVIVPQYRDQKLPCMPSPLQMFCMSHDHTVVAITPPGMWHFFSSL